MERLQLRSELALSNRAFVLVADKRGQQFVTAVDTVAEIVGLKPGITLADARALVPDVIFQSDDPTATAELLVRLAERCRDYTPWTAIEGRNGIFLDITGCAHFFGSEIALMTNLSGCLSRLGFTARIALAPVPGAAWALARFGKNMTIVGETDIRDAIASLPVAGLRLDVENITTLDRLGLRRIGDLYSFSRASLVTRFGEKIAIGLDRALGRIAEPISPSRHVAPFKSRINFAEPIGHLNDIKCGLERLIGDLTTHLNHRGRGAKLFELQIIRVDGSLEKLSVGTVEVSRDPKHIGRLFHENLTSVDMGFGIETMVLSSFQTVSFIPNQTAIDGRAGSESIETLLDRLGNRIGFSQLYRLEFFESYLPEHAQRLTSVFAEAPCTVLGKVEVAMGERPLRILIAPELVMPLTREESDISPPTAFRWRGCIHRLRRIDGPERIAAEWWRQDRNKLEDTRDYWHIEDSVGRHFWLYREGSGVQQGNWFVHGVFS